MCMLGMLIWFTNDFMELSLVNFGHQPLFLFLPVILEIKNLQPMDFLGLIQGLTL